MSPHTTGVSPHANTTTTPTSQPLRDSLSTNEPILPSEMTLRSLFSDIEVIRNYNSALVEERAMVVWAFEIHMMGPPARMKK